jgi:four helix bundle protein
VVTAVYRQIRQSALEEDDDLRRQLTRASVSMMSNIAEGFGRETDGDFLRFLRISRGSGTELQSVLYVCADLGYVTEPERERLHSQAGRCLAAVASLQAYLRRCRTSKTG